MTGGTHQAVVDRFADAFGCRARSPETEADIAAAEEAVGRPFPPGYRDVLLRYGPLDCPDLLDRVVEAAAALPVLQTFAPALGVPSETANALGSGLAPGLVVFAHDPTGCPFCFRRHPETDQAVLFYDIDLRDLQEAAPSLETLFSRYLAL